ncbi:MAG: sigma-70 family RNA polymerase sigma factor [Actinobacteria bacterium]|nr:sigma-70 family RNA polymerase sigma factor [Actinomycetota bacterium]
MGELLELIADTVSLEAPVGEGESVYGDMIEDRAADSPDAVSTEHARSADLAEALAALDPRMRRVVERRYGLDGDAPQTLEELGADLGVTRERVRQLEMRALRALREGSPGLSEYL